MSPKLSISAAGVTLLAVFVVLALRAPWVAAESLVEQKSYRGATTILFSARSKNEIENFYSGPRFKRFGEIQESKIGDVDVIVVMVVWGFAREMINIFIYAGSEERGRWGLWLFRRTGHGKIFVQPGQDGKALHFVSGDDGAAIFSVAEKDLYR